MISMTKDNKRHFQKVVQVLAWLCVSAMHGCVYVCVRV